MALHQTPLFYFLKVRFYTWGGLMRLLVSKAELSIQKIPAMLRT